MVERRTMKHLHITELSFYKFVAVVALLISVVTVLAVNAKADGPSTELVADKGTVVNVYVDCGSCCNEEALVGPVVVRPTVVNTNTNTNENTIIINAPPTPLSSIVVEKNHINIHNNFHPKLDIKVNSHNKTDKTKDATPGKTK